MPKHWLVGACLALIVLIAHADPQSTYQWMLHNQAINSAVAQNSQAVVTIGSLFYSFDHPSQQNLSATLLRFFQQQDATIQQFTLVDPQSGNTVGTYANGTLTLSAH